MKGTIITLSVEHEEINIINEFAKLKEKIVDGITVEEKESLRVITSIEYSNTGIHLHIFLNKKIDLDISKEWLHGQSNTNYFEKTDQCKKALKYMIA